MRTLKELNGNGDTDNGNILNLNDMSNPKLVEFFLDSIENKSTHEHYGRYLRFFLDFVEDVPLKDLKPYHLTQWIEQRQNDVGILKKTTVKSYLTCVSSFYKHIIDNGYETPMNPAPATMKQLTKGAVNKQYEPLTIEEIKQILQSTTSPRERALILILFKTGCRISEITNLRIGDVNLDTGIISVRGRKHHPESVTHIPIDAELHTAITNWLYFRPKGKSDYLFVSYYGEGLTTTRMREIVLKCGRNAGIIKPANSHRYRYSFTTTLSDNQCNPSVIAYLRGDSAKTMVAYYSRPDFETKIRPEYLKSMPKLL